MTDSRVLSFMGNQNHEVQWKYSKDYVILVRIPWIFVITDSSTESLMEQVFISASLRKTMKINGDILFLKQKHFFERIFNRLFFSCCCSYLLELSFHFFQMSKLHR